MSYIYPLKEWEEKVLKHFRRQEKKQDIKPLSNHKIQQLTEEIFLKD